MLVKTKAVFNFAIFLLLVGNNKKMVKLKTAFTSEIDKIFNIYEITIVQ